MSKIIITEPGNIDKASKRRLQKEGYLLIESKDTSKVKIVGDEDFVIGSDLFMAAMKGANHDMYSRDDMVRELCARLKRAEELNSFKDSKPSLTPSLLTK